jgi:predicted nucleotidyltransferase component of viral defense system
MNERANRKYKHILEIIGHVAKCSDGKLILIGGTALALFYLKHRVSVDLDFIPANGDESKLKEMLKGCLTKHGYRTATAAFTNQFVIHFPDTSIKVEIFSSDYAIRKIENFAFGVYSLTVASLDDLLQLKIIAYKDRKEARDLYDIVCILQIKSMGFSLVKSLVKEFGLPLNENELGELITDQKSYEVYKGVLKNVSEASD